MNWIFLTILLTITRCQWSSSQKVVAPAYDFFHVAGFTLGTLLNIVEPSVLRSSETWSEAVNACEIENTSLSSEVYTYYKTNVWLGKYRARTPWRHLIGCFDISDWEVADSFNLSKNEVTACFHKCYSNNKEYSTFFIALWGSRCMCIHNDTSFMKRKTAPVQCTINCAGGSTMPCGGESSLYSVYRIDTDLPFEKRRGYCQYIDRNGTSKQSGCNKNKKYLICKIEGQYKEISDNVYGKNAELKCRDSNGTLPYISDKVVIDNNSEYWIGSRIVSKILDLHDIKPIAEYVETCIKWTTKNTEQSCAAQLKFYCNQRTGKKQETSRTFHEGIDRALVGILTTLVFILAFVLLMLFWNRCRQGKERKQSSEMWTSRTTSSHACFVSDIPPNNEIESPYDIISEENPENDYAEVDENYAICNPIISSSYGDIQDSSYGDIQDSFDSCFDKTSNETGGHGVCEVVDNDVHGVDFSNSKNDAEECYSLEKVCSSITEDYEMCKTPVSLYYVLEEKKDETINNAIHICQAESFPESSSLDINEYSYCVVNSEDNYNHLNFRIDHKK